MRRGYRHAGGTVTVETERRDTKPHRRVDQIAAFNAFLKVIHDHATARFRFEPGSP